MSGADPFGNGSSGDEETAEDILGKLLRRVTIWLTILTILLVPLAILTFVNSSRTGRLAERNCGNVSALAGIERTFIQQQQQQTTNLLKSGVTFGIPKDQIGGLVKANEASQRAFLSAFDALALTNC